ncbi:MAG: zinc-binding dehydrogenase [Chloroflexaceae bacterium]|nr:zinc-binding dehydrogenase [Chloroflexaceae bacterium]
MTISPEPGRVPNTMQAIHMHQYGGPLVVETMPVPALGPTDVLVQMSATPLNPSDLMFIKGRYGLNKPVPVVPGLEGSGTIVAVGRAWWLRPWLGRRVACGAPEDSDGTWAEYMRTSFHRCFFLADTVSNVQGATMIVNPLTAWALVEQVRKGNHRAAIQTAAASSLGQMINRLMQRFKLPLINIVRREEQVTMLKEQGAPYVLNSSAPDFERQLGELSHQIKATIALDAISGQMTGQLLNAMPHTSEVIVYGALSEQAAMAHPGDLIFKHKRVRGFWLSDWIEQQTILGIIQTGTRVQQMLHTDLKTTVQAGYPLAEIEQAISHYKQQMSGGKVLLLPGLHRTNAVAYQEQAMQ